MTNVTSCRNRPDPRKVETIDYYLKLPDTQKRIESFIGMTGFYRKFIKDYAKIAYQITV